MLARPWNAPSEWRTWQRCLLEAGAAGRGPWRRVERWADAKTTSSSGCATLGAAVALGPSCPSSSHSALPCVGSPSARAHLPTCSFHQRVPRRLPGATRFLSHSQSKAPELLTPSLLMAGSYEHRYDLPRIWLVTDLRAPVLGSLSPLPLRAQCLYCAAPRFSSWMEVLCAV